MNLKMRFWCPKRNRFMPDVRCWVSYDGQFHVISSVEEDVIPQLSTGCHDKNKTEIFEGDKINYAGHIGTVEFFAGQFQLDWGDQTDNCISCLMIDKMEVVGNIFESVTKVIEPVGKEEPKEEEEDLLCATCEQCGEKAWDGYICHACGLKII